MLATKRDDGLGNPFFYCVGSQCFRPSGSVVSLNVPSVLAGSNVIVSTCKSQNSALICLPLRCGPIVIPAPPPGTRFTTYGAAAALPVHEPLTAGGPL